MQSTAPCPCQSGRAYAACCRPLHSGEAPAADAEALMDPAGVKWVRLRYRSVNQHQDYRTLAMVPTGDEDQYHAVIPAEDIPPTWDLMYFIEAMDKDGNGRIYPDLNHQTPYIVVKLQR